MPALKIAIELASLQQPLKQAMQTASRLGARGVVFDARGELRPKDLSGTARRQLRKMLADLGLSVCAVSFRTRRGYADREELDRRVAATKEALSFAHALGTSVVINQIGPIPEDESTDEWSTLLGSLTDIGRHAERAGAFLAAETGRQSATQLARLIDTLPKGSLAINFNPGQLLLFGHPPLEAISQLSSNIVHVHATDATSDPSQPIGQATLLGRGSVDYPALLAMLQQRGYQGYFTLTAPGIAEGMGYLESL